MKPPGALPEISAFSCVGSVKQIIGKIIDPPSRPISRSAVRAKTPMKRLARIPSTVEILQLALYGDRRAWERYHRLEG
jgi:hypothetical protein